MKQLIFHYLGFNYTNIGDYIQSLAAKQYAKDEKDIIYWQRDDLGLFNQEKVYAIMNGWYLHKTENWPPSENIDPIFVSVHFNAEAYDSLLSDTSLEYLKKHQPIGCRDKMTAHILKQRGVDAYFTSCLTTTLGYKYKKSDNSPRQGIYIVDPVHYIPESSRRLMKYRYIPKYILHKRGIDRYIKSLLENNSYDITWKKKHFEVLAQATRSYVLLRKILGKKLLTKATILTQFHFAEEIPDNKSRFDRAEQLLNIYSKAELVITSRIHCALPCLGLETPVIFLQNMDDTIESTCRFDGLIDLLNVIKFKKNDIVESKFKLPLDPTEVRNSNSYWDKAQKLISKCSAFAKLKSTI